MDRIPKYDTVRRNVLRLRGRAQDLPCIRCGGTATNWTLTGEPKWFDPHPYSDDLDAYAPMCVPCQFSSRVGVPTYEAVHKQLRRWRGKAREHPCTHCGDAARHWALIGESKWADPSGHPYTDDLDAYTPLCVACHLALDRGWERCPHGSDERDPWGDCRTCRLDRYARLAEDRTWKDARNAEARERYARHARGPNLSDYRRQKALTPEQALAIRNDPRSYRDLAAEYGISESQISRIKTGKSWKNL